MGGLHLANADTPLVLPIDNLIRLLTTSGDVIHSLGVPSLGIKGDAIPGRLNGVSLLINRTGSFYGQCSELCGVNHAFMPINIVGVEINDFISWLSCYEI
jgi:cytochrome c oxidase subunit 2